MNVKKSLNDYFELENKVKIPALGYGTYRSDDDVVADRIKMAADCGYRHIDTASFYNNEKGVGEGVRNCGVKRDELFVVTKVWNTDRGYDKVMAAFDASMNKLDIDYLDMLLVHWPANKKVYGDDARKVNADTWAAFEELYNTRKVKVIGVSNFKPHHLTELIEDVKIKPMVNQIEFHPGFPQLETVKFCHENNIVIEAWSPLGRKEVFNNELIVSLAKKYGKTPAQICLRFSVQNDILPLPKASTIERIKENTEIYDFEMSDDDIAKIAALSNIGGKCLDPDEQEI